MRWALLFALCTALWAPAQEFSRLPDWAAAPALAAQSAPAPQDAEAWVLLDRTEIAYAGDGEIRLRHLRLIKVLEEAGIRHRTYALFGFGGKAHKVKRLKGWNLRPDGELVRLDDDHVGSMNDATDAEFSTTTLTTASLTRVMKGSLLAFESLESLQSPIGPVAEVGPMETLPVRTWELEVAKKEGWFTNLRAVEVKMDRRHFKPWLEKVEELPGGGLRARDLPALPLDEGAHPHISEVLPLVQVRFLDPNFPLAAMWGSWDAYARWISEMYQPAFQPTGVPDLKRQTGLEGLRALWAWMRTGLTYKAVYLSPERGWVPEKSSEVGRKRYGDCKDLTTFFLGEAKGLGFKVAPALARISSGRLEADEPPFNRFNHVISAIRLESSLGLPAEVETRHGRVLLLDPTDMGTPLGYLSSGHLEGRLLICLPEGAVWVEVPAAAILPDRLAFELKGEVVGRELRGTITLRETGYYLGLRGTARQGGSKALKSKLLESFLDLPPTATLEVESTSDPLDLDRPFEVRLAFKHPQGLRVTGTEARLADLGIPGPRGTIQRAGKPRRYPIVSMARGELSYRAEVKLPGTVTPILPEQTGESPLRSFAWSSKATHNGGMTTLVLRLDHRNLPVRFGFDALDQGLKVWKQDRSLVKTFRDDALTLRMGQP